MHKKLNVKLVGTVLGILLSASVAVYFLHDFQLVRNAHRLLDLADRAVANRQDAQALGYYEQYLSLARDDVDALQRYAELLDRQEWDDGEREQLVSIMQQVLREKPTQHELRMRLAQNLILMDRFAEAIDQLQRLEPTWSDKADLWHIIGWCQEAVSDYRSAAKSFEAAIRLNTQQIHSYALLAEVYELRLSQPEEAERVMDALVNANSRAYQAYLLRAQLHRRRGADKAAIGDLQTAYRLAPDQPEAILALADAALAAGNREEAARLLLDGSRRFPDQAVFYHGLASVKMQANDRVAALKYIKDGLRHATASSDLTLLIIDLMIDQKQYGEARAKIDDLVKAGWKPTIPNYFKARLAVADKQWSEGIDLLQSVRRELGEQSEWHGRVYALLGYCYRQLGDAEAELQAFRKAVHHEPNWLPGNLGLGAAYLRQGRIDEARQTLEPLRTAKDLPNAYWTLLAQERLTWQMKQPASERRWTEVEEALKKADARSVEASVTRAGMYVGRGDTTSAKAVLDQLQASGLDKQAAKLALPWAEAAVVQPPRDHRDAVWLARFYQAAEDNVKAEALLRSALEQAGHSPDAWLAWASFLHQTNRRQLALTELERMKMELPASRQPLTIARYYEALGMRDEAAKAYAEALRLTPDDPDVRAFAAEFNARQKAGKGR
jgi:tetratricopeptide (TPR) repeat protein